MTDTKDALAIPLDPGWSEIRDGVRHICNEFPNAYWVKLDRDSAYPTEFVEALTKAGYLGALIPEEYGGAGLPLSAGCAILETIHGRAATRRPATPRCTPWDGAPAR